MVLTQILLQHVVQQNLMETAVLEDSETVINRIYDGVEA